jgi:tetratricopeptide (TPR) repeat protein
MGYFRKGPEQYILEGNNKILLGDYKAAVLEFTKAIIEDPYMPQPYTCRASAKLELRDYKGAIADCQEALKLHFQLELKSDQNGTKRREINPIYGKIYSIIGISKLLLGNIEDGFVDLNSSRLLGYSDSVDIIKAYSK